MNKRELREALRLDWIVVDGENKVACENTKIQVADMYQTRFRNIKIGRSALKNLPLMLAPSIPLLL
jgi:hypothetical protein